MLVSRIALAFSGRPCTFDLVPEGGGGGGGVVMLREQNMY